MAPTITTVEHHYTKPWFPHSTIWPRWLRWTEHFVRVKLFKQRSYFIDLWTIDDSAEIECMHGIDLEEELVKALTEEIAKEIAENGSCTWAEFCEKEKNKPQS